MRSLAAVAASSGFGSGDRRDRYLTPVEIAAKVEADDERLTLETAELALALGSDINLVNRNGDSALHLAAGQGLVTVVQFLVEYGAVLDVKNKRGLTPLGMALQRPRGEGGVTTPDERREAAAQLLRKRGAPSNQPRGAGRGRASREMTNAAATKGALRIAESATASGHNPPSSPLRAIIVKLLGTISAVDSHSLPDATYPMTAATTAAMGRPTVQ